MTVKTYDQKSYDLAEHFLSDSVVVATDKAKDELAKVIQTAIEDWLNEHGFQS